jgi:hypothetical protein
MNIVYRRRRHENAIPDCFTPAGNGLLPSSKKKGQMKIVYHRRSRESDMCGGLAAAGSKSLRTSSLPAVRLDSEATS